MQWTIKAINAVFLVLTSSCVLFIYHGFFIAFLHVFAHSLEHTVINLKLTRAFK